MKQVETVSLAELVEMSKNMFEGMVKTDVDIAKEVMIVDMGMHADGEAFLLEAGSKQNDLWGINLHPEAYGTDDFIEFDSMINIRPSQGNPSKDVLDETTRQKIIEVVNKVVHE